MNAIQRTNPDFKQGLTSLSSSDDLLNYFEYICKLVDNEQCEFPVNLDDVWPLVYADKGKAVRALRDGFIENVDYQRLPELVTEQSAIAEGGYNRVTYYISASCLEYLIARKKHKVFEMYRRVFHAARRGELPHQKVDTSYNSQLQYVQTQIYIVEAVSRNLRLSEASRLGMYQSIAEPYRLAIPQYVPSKGVLKSASVLLKENNCDISVIKFNQLLEAHGFVETISRPSSSGKVRKFKNITVKGIVYGENEVNPKNQKETQPHWYADKFRELYNLVTA